MEAHRSHRLRMAEARADDLRRDAHQRRLVSVARGRRHPFADVARRWLVNAVLGPELEERLARLTARQAEAIAVAMRETMWELDLPVDETALNAAVARSLRATATGRTATCRSA